VSTRISCHHCGEPCTDVIVLDDKSFCCSGCKTVYELLQENDLCTYYDLEQHPGQKLDFSVAHMSKFAYLDDAEIADSLIEFQNGEIAKTTLSLPQIHCASCLWLLEKLYCLNTAILRSEVNFFRKECTITFNPREISIRGVVELLTRLGYEPHIHLGHADNSSSPSHASPQRSLYRKIGLAGFSFGNIMLMSFPEYFSAGTLADNFQWVFGALNIALALPVLVYSAADYFTSAYYSLKQKVIGIDFPLALGIAVIFIRSVYEISTGIGPGYLDSFTGLIFFLLIGKLAQQKTFDTLSFDRDYKSYFPIAVTVVEETENEIGFMEVSRPISQIQQGDTLFLRHGELIPTDCVLHSENASIDYSFVSGESEPVDVESNTTVYAGGRVVGQAIYCRVIKEVSQSFLTRLWNNDAFSKEKTTILHRRSDTFGKYFTLFTLFVACCGALYWLPDVAAAFNVFTSVLIVACPCAYTLAAPFGFGTLLKILGRRGVYIKNNETAAELAQIDTIVFDKTGTLTSTHKADIEFVCPQTQQCSNTEQKSFHQALKERETLPITHLSPLSTTHCSVLPPADLHALSAILRYSSHPMSTKVHSYIIQNTHQQELVEKQVMDFCEIAGKGVRASCNGHVYYLGSHNWMQESLTSEALNAMPSPSQRDELHGALVHCAKDDTYLGCFVVKSEYRSGIENIFTALPGSMKKFLLSGDNNKERGRFSSFFTNDALLFEQSPEDKMNFVANLKSKGKTVMMVGDGLNDAGALRQSNVGVALTEKAGAFTPASDIIMDAEELKHMPHIMKFARYATLVVAACFVVSLCYNLVGLTFAVTGHLSPLVCAILMPVSSLTVIGIATFAVEIYKTRLPKRG
jgi:Cu+-exporting ATPase